MWLQALHWEAASLVAAPGDARRDAHWRWQRLPLVVLAIPAPNVPEHDRGHSQGLVAALFGEIAQNCGRPGVICMITQHTAKSL